LQNRNCINAKGIETNPKLIADVIAKSVEIKCRIVESDPHEKGSERMLLNLGHTFGHALESSLGLGAITHGEAVAWGLARSCELSFALGIINQTLKDQIAELLQSFGYETRSPHPEMKDAERFMNALMNDKKKKSGKLNFIVPNENGAQIAAADTIPSHLLKEILGNE
jgi:3-dehydroquinate synthase